MFADLSSRLVDVAVGAGVLLMFLGVLCILFLVLTGVCLGLGTGDCAAEPSWSLLGTNGRSGSDSATG